MMNVYIEKQFVENFLKIGNDGEEIKIIWEIIQSYAEVTWFFEEDLTQENYEILEISNQIYKTIATKSSNIKFFNKDFCTEIKRNKDKAQILLADNDEDWHDSVSDYVLIMSTRDFHTKIKDFKRKFSFRFIVNENDHWNELDKLRSAIIKDIVIIDNYCLTDYFEKNDLRKFKSNFIYILNKIVSRENNLKILVQPNKIGRGNYQEEKLKDLGELIRDNTNIDSEIQLINSKLKSKFDFHDRNIVTAYYILRSGKGFSRETEKMINSEVECLCILEPWGYNLIRHRKGLLADYELAISKVSSSFVTVNI